MAKPIIGISGSVLDIENGPFTGSRRAYVNEDYVKAVVKSGGVPVIIPMTADKEIIDIQLDGIDALLLSGGHDIDPSEYGEAPKPRLNETLPERDKFDILLVEGAVKRGIPVLGICRGHQVLNVALGGSLHQDLEYIEGCEEAHDQFESEDPESHAVRTKERSILRELLGETLKVNSFHHLAIKELAPGFRATAISSDGLIEGIEHSRHKFIVGVQWHPEALASSGDRRMERLFEEFVYSAKALSKQERYPIAI
ncbi:putative glutamine amidotransferasec [Andreesenia angusta]|uniref:Putative glutamine amidotransferasec n=1 Tax=Andreesenia angusta TaxID=39480 RepID=A0A1S1V6A5_9FIRM|nr:gamma-glutamyl-gamma-aminobutyrate hydrolase family protein [Andreesenia angusta]OHW61647.1 putative glutamine amidotransferasec [Andreesenia angusta]